VAVYDLPPLSHIPPECRQLPRVAYVFQIHSHQRPTGLEEGIFYGDNVRRLIPTLVHPNEILDGAVLRGFMGRNATTYAVQNHPVIEALYRQHGKDLMDALVSLGNSQASVSLPGVQRVLGIPWDAHARERATGLIEGRLGMICGAVEQVGASRLTATAM
jgi:hypothetical protein